MYAKLAYKYSMENEHHKTAKDERIAARVSSEYKLLFEKAAMMCGLSLTDFMTTSAIKEARRVLHEHQALVSLTESDSALFVDSLMNPRNTNELPELAEAFKKYKNTMER